MLSSLRRRRADQLSSRSRARQGQALVEFAIVSILMVLILATVADFGRLFYSQITVENAARAGALVAAREPSSYTGACATASAANRIGCAIAAESRGSGSTIAASEVTVTCVTFANAPLSPCPTSPQPNVRSKVTIVKSFGFVMPVLRALFGNTITMTASVAADHQSMPPAPTYAAPTSTATATPTATATATPTAAPTATATATATATPTPTPTPAPCVAGYAPVPDLVVGATPGSTETVGEARAEWLTAGFTLNNLSPTNGSTNKRVLSQFPNDIGLCKSVTTYAVTVSHT